MRRNGIPRGILFAYINTLSTRSYNSLDPQSDELTLKCESCPSSSESAEARAAIGREAFLRPNILLRAVRRTDFDRSGVEEMRRRANSPDGLEVSMEGLEMLACRGACPAAPVSCGLRYSSLSNGSCIGIGLEIWPRAILELAWGRSLGLLLTAAALDDRGMPWGGRGDEDDRCIFSCNNTEKMTCKKEKEKGKMENDSLY